MENIQLKTIRQRAAVRVACGKPASRAAALSGETAGSAVTGKADWGGPSAGWETLAPLGSYWEQSSTLGGPHKSWREGNLRMVTPPWRRGGGDIPATFVESQVRNILFAFIIFIYLIYTKVMYLKYTKVIFAHCKEFIYYQSM